MPRHPIRFPSLFGLIVLAAAVPAAHAAHGPDEHVGKVSFPTSCSPQAQPELNKGLALLHSFQYQESAQAFSGAAQQDADMLDGLLGQGHVALPPALGISGRLRAR